MSHQDSKRRKENFFFVPRQTRKNGVIPFFCVCLNNFFLTKLTFTLGLVFNKTKETQKRRNIKLKASTV